MIVAWLTAILVITHACDMWHADSKAYRMDNYGERYTYIKGRVVAFKF